MNESLLEVLCAGSVFYFRTYSGRLISSITKGRVKPLTGPDGTLLWTDAHANETNLLNIITEGNLVICQMFYGNYAFKDKSVLYLSWFPKGDLTAS